MAMKYVAQIRSKALSTRSKKKPSAPVLSKEDEEFLNQVTSQPGDKGAPGATGQENGEVGKDPQIALMDGAQDIPLPISPPEEAEEESAGLGTDDKGVKSPEAKSTEVESSDAKSPERKGKKVKSPERKEKEAKGKSRAPWNWMKKDKKKESEASTSTADKKAPDVEARKTGDLGDEEVKDEKDALEDVLEGLNLSAVNNRAFSVSDETQELLRKFKVVFTDLVRGVPTAYDDLESLLTNGDQQLQKSYDHLPGFLQKLVEQLPDKITEKLGPEVLATVAEKAGSSSTSMEDAGKAAASAAKKKGLKTPSLKDLVGKPGAIAGMLRSIYTFLQTKFPAIVGMNVLWSLALFILLFVFWYCHKRGREVRLERERLLTEQEVAQLEAEYESAKAVEGLTTTAPEGASIDAVQAGVREVQQARENQSKEEEDANKEKKIDVYPGT